MDKYVLALLVSVAVISAVLVIFWLYPLEISSSPEECEAIFLNEGQDKVDIVFLTNGVAKGKVGEYVQLFLGSEPFSSNKEKINFFYAGEGSCEIKDGLLYCYSGENLKKAAACKNDYIIVLSEKPGNIRSSAYINLISVNINHPKTVLLHEFGHVFATLADEYVPSVLPRGAKNCQDKCDDFEVMDGCFDGCTKSELLRSSESSVMRTLRTSDYETLNTLLIERNLDKYE